MNVRFTPLMLSFLLFLTAVGPAVAQDQQSTSFVSQVEVTDQAVFFQPREGTYSAFTMTLSGPDDFWLEKRFAGDETPRLALKTDEGLNLPDGSYMVEVKAQPLITDQDRAALDEARQRGDRYAMSKIMKEIGLNPGAMVYSMSLGVLDGKFLDSDGEQTQRTDEQNAGTVNSLLGAQEPIPGFKRLPGTPQQPGTQQNASCANAAGGLRTASLNTSCSNPAVSWKPASFTKTAPDGAGVSFQGFMRPVASKGPGQKPVFEAYFQRTGADAADEESWVRGYFEADGEHFRVVDQPALESATANTPTGLFDYVVNEGTAVAGPDDSRLDTCQPDDLVVDGSLNIGFDSVCNRNFGFDTFVLSENNLRIFFEDTSNSASFPSNDWRILINDTNNGGANYFSIQDTNTGRQSFLVEAGAGSNALYVESDSDVGFGTANPVVTLHAVDGNTPTLRLEQDGTQGFTPQTWDVAGNEANFFIRDATNGSKLPLRITPNTPSNTLRMFTDRIALNDGAGDYDVQIKGDNNNNLFYVDASTDRVGIGINDPAGRLHVDSPGTNSNVILARRSGTTNTIFRVFEDGAGNALLDVRTAAGDRAIEMTGNGGGRLSVGCQTPQNDLDLGNDPTQTCAAVGSRSFINAGSTTFTASSSRLLKENIVPIEMNNILDKIIGVGVYQYDFIDGPKGRLGLMAEDFHTIFGRGSDKLLDGQEVQMALWLGVQQLTLRNNALSAENAKLAVQNEQIAVQNAKLAAQNEQIAVQNALLEQRLARIEAILGGQ